MAGNHHVPILTLLEHAAALTSVDLRLSYGQHVGGLLRALADRHRGLRVLKLAEESVSDEALLCLFQHCTMLEVLEMPAVSVITKEGKPVSLRQLPLSLRKLVVCGLDLVDGLAIETLTRCTALQSLSMLDRER